MSVVHCPLDVLQTRPSGQLSEVHLALHCLVVVLQMVPELLLLQSASVTHWQNPGLA